MLDNVMSLMLFQLCGSGYFILVLLCGCILLFIRQVIILCM